MDKSKFKFINDLSIKLSRYESTRKEYMKFLIKFEAITLLITFFVGYITYMFIWNYGWADGLILLVVAILLGLFIVVAFPFHYDKIFSSDFKDTYRKEIEETFNINIRGKAIDSDFLLKCDLFSDFNVFHNDDVIQGIHNGVEYRITEARLELKDTGKNNSNYNFKVFSGIVIDLPLNKTVKGKTIITTKNDINKTKGLPVSFIIYAIFIGLAPSAILVAQGHKLSTILIGLFIPLSIVAIIIFGYNFLSRLNARKYSSAKLEDISFNNRFVVKTEDQVEGRYLVTPAFMERLMGIQTAFGTKNIKCAFFDDKILFAIETNKDLFEICSFFQKMGDPKIIQNFYDEIVSIQNMIDHFKLNEKTGL